jgi:hypothetical protein
MKKLAIFGIAVLLVAFGAGMALANPQSDDVNAGTNTANSGNAVESGGSTGNTSAGVGDIASQGSSLVNTETKTWDNGNTTESIDGNSLLSGNTKTVTVDESGQNNSANDSFKKVEAEKNSGAQNAGNSNSATNTDTKTVTIDESGQNNSKTCTDNSVYTKTEDSNNTKTYTDSSTYTKTETGNLSAKEVEAEKNIAGAQNAGLGNSATNTNELLSNNTKNEAEKNIAGAQNAGSGSAENTIKLLSDNNTTVGKAYAKDGSAAAGVGDATNTNTDTKTITIDESGQVSKHNNANGNYGSAVAQDGSTANNTYTKTTTTTIDKSGQNNSKQIIDDTKYGSAAAINGNATVDKSKKITLYAVDNQVMDACITGISNTTPECCPSPVINQTMNKTVSASTSNSLNGFTGVGNNANAAGNFNNAKAYTAFNLNGGVGNTTAP